MSFAVQLLIGLACGVLSGCGIGGGTFLLLYMTCIADVPQSIAQGINLLYFIPTSGASVFSHVKNRLIDLNGFWWCAVPGALAALSSALFATSIEMSLLKKLFGGFLIAAGIRQLLKR